MLVPVLGVCSDLDIYMQYVQYHPSERDSKSKHIEPILIVLRVSVPTEWFCMSIMFKQDKEIKGCIGSLQLERVCARSLNPKTAGGLSRLT